MNNKLNNKFVPRAIPGFHCVGWVKDAHGLRGEIYVQLQAKNADWLSELNILGICNPKGGDFVEHKVKAARPHKEGLLVTLEGMTDRNQSEAIRKFSVYISEKLLEADEGDAIFLKQILGFMVVTVAGENIGEIVGFATNGAQDLLRVTRDQGEALIPMVDAFLRHIDFDQRKVTMELPPGLLDS